MYFELSKCTHTMLDIISALCINFSNILYSPLKGACKLISYRSNMVKSVSEHKFPLRGLVNDLIWYKVGLS